MEYLSRNIDNSLREWAAQPVLKPLLLRDARQVRKSRTVKNLGKSFAHYIELNFERQPELKEIFAHSLDVHEIVKRIGLLAKVDYVTIKDMKVLPIEIKVGTSGKMKSLRQFMTTKGLSHAVHSSLQKAHWHR